MGDPKQILAEIESLIMSYYYVHAQKRLQEALDLPVDRTTRHRILLRTIEVTYNLGDLIVPELLTELRGHLKSKMDVEAKAETLHVICLAEARMGSYQKAANLAQESLALYREGQNLEAIISVLNTLAGVYGHLALKNEGKKFIVEALRLAREYGDSQGYGKALMACALSEREHGLNDLARDHYELASQLLEEAGEKYFFTIALNNLADIEITQGHLSKGLHLLQRALFQWSTLGNRRKVALILTQIGRVFVLKGNLQAAERFLDSAINLTAPDQTQNPLTLYYALCNKADFERKRGQLDQALHLAQEAISLLERSDISGSDLGYAWGMVTSILLEMRDILRAEDALATGEIICSSLEFSEGIVNNILLRGILELHKGNLGIAQEHLEAARKKAEENKLLEVQIQTELSLSDLHLRRLMMGNNKIEKEEAANCLLRASWLAEKTALVPWKLEAQILKAAAHSISLRFEEAVEILRNVEAKARGLGLHLIELKAQKIRMPIQSRMRVLSIPTDPDEEMLEYIAKAQEYVLEAQTAFRGTLERP